MTNVRIGIRPGDQRMSIDQLARDLETGSPRVFLRREQMPAGYLVLNPRELDDAYIRALRPTFERALQANWQA